MRRTARTGSEKGTDLSRFWGEIEPGGWGASHPYLLLLGLDPMGTLRLVERVEEGFSFGLSLVFGAAKADRSFSRELQRRACTRRRNSP
jgi:hypothetical protein